MFFSYRTKVILAEGPFFTGSALKLRANRGLSPAYDIIKAIAGPHDVSEQLSRPTVGVVVGMAVALQVAQ